MRETLQPSALQKRRIGSGLPATPLSFEMTDDKPYNEDFDAEYADVPSIPNFEVIDEKNIILPHF